MRSTRLFLRMKEGNQHLRQMASIWHEIRHFHKIKSIWGKNKITNVSRRIVYHMSKLSLRRFGYVTTDQLLLLKPSLKNSGSVDAHFICTHHFYVRQNMGICSMCLIGWSWISFNDTWREWISYEVLQTCKAPFHIRLWFMRDRGVEQPGDWKQLPFSIFGRTRFCKFMANGRKMSDIEAKMEIKWGCQSEIVTRTLRVTALHAHCFLGSWIHSSQTSLQAEKRTMRRVTLIFFIERGQIKNNFIEI